MALRVGIPLLTLIALGRASLAAPPAPVPLHIDFAAPAGCSHVGAFYAGVLARTDRARRAKAGEKGPRFRVRLTRTGAKVHGELSVIADRGAGTTRKVDGESCNEVVEVLSLTVAMALDPAAGPLPSPVLAPPPASVSAPPSGPAPSPAPAAPGPAAKPTPPSIAPAAAAAPPPAPLPSPEPPRPPVAAPTVAAPGPAAPEPPIANVPALAASPSDDRPARTYAVDLGVRAVVANVVSPYVSLGGALSVLVTGKRNENVPPSLGIALMHVPNNVFLPSPDVVVRWTALALTACPPLGFGGRLQVQPCLLGIGGWLAATERAVSNPLSAGRTWWSAGAVVRATLPLGRGFSVDLDLGISAPLVKRRFIVTSPDATVGETPSISALAGIGVSHSL